MITLVINAGSSSLKYKLFDLDADTVIAEGNASRIGEAESAFVHRSRRGSTTRALPIASHRDAMALAVEAMLDPFCGALERIEQIQAVGHRAVHGADVFVEPAIVSDDVVRQLEECTPLAPLHNPANLLGIREAQRLLPDVPHVAVFDTAFHSAMPRYAYTYALPSELCATHRIRKYGFHGTSCEFVSRRAAELLQQNPKELKMIVCHLGNGASVTAVSGGRSIDTSLGFGTMSGVMMGTRAGDVDPAIVFYLHRQLGMSLESIEKVLLKESGLLGVSGVSNDLRVVEEQAAGGHALSGLALEMFAYRVKLYIGAYVAALGGLDALVFTAGIGENSAAMRERICTGLGALGIGIDRERNGAIRCTEALISTDDSAVAVYVVPTDEERAIALQTQEVIARDLGISYATVSCKKGA